MAIDWKAKVDRLVAALSAGDARLARYRQADAEMVRRAMAGLGPDSPRPVAASGMRVVYNLSSAHVPAVLKGGDNAYKNRYDLGQGHSALRIGEPPPATPSVREYVDGILAKMTGHHDGSGFYFGAVELNGTGVRFYGDMCLVLKPDVVANDTLVLYRNSYDLVRKPLSDVIDGNDDVALDEARNVQGSWPDVVPDMAVSKVLESSRVGERRMTTGMISAGVLDDEDYLEVVKEGSFGANALEEIRVTSPDVATEAHIADRMAHGPIPSLSELLWRHRRRMAQQAASDIRVPVRVITSQGRTRS